MAPDEHIWTPHFTCRNRVGKLVAIARIADEQQVVERHVEFVELGVRLEVEVVGRDALDRPDEAPAERVQDAVACAQKAAEISRERAA